MPYAKGPNDRWVWVEEGEAGIKADPAKSTTPSSDLIGGTAAAPAAAPPPVAPVDPNDKKAWERANQKSKPKEILDKNVGTGAPLDAGMYADGGTYDNFSDSTKDAYDYYRDIRDPGSVKDYLNSMGEQAGVSHAGDVMVGDLGTVHNPLDYNPLAPLTDTETGIGTTADGMGGQPMAQDNQALQLAGGAPILDTTANAAGDALDKLMGGLGGPDYGKFDTSGADRGGMADHSGDLGRVRGLADSARGLGADVLSGALAPPNASDAQRQSDVMGKVQAFAPDASARAAKSAANFAAGPKAANDVLSQVAAFAQGPEGPSKAQLLHDEASQKAMADVLSASRSGRARDAGSQARAANVAQAEIAGMGVDNARNAGLLRADEADKQRQQTLQALGLSGDLAQGLDTTKLGALSLQGDLAKSRDSSALQALGLGSDLASQMRGQGIQERGQGLDFMQGQQQIGAGLEGDVLGTIPALEQVRHKDQFELTPQQQLAAAQMGGAPDKTTLDYILGLGKDLLPLIG